MFGFGKKILEHKIIKFERKDSEELNQYGREGWQGVALDYESSRELFFLLLLFLEIPFCPKSF